MTDDNKTMTLAEEQSAARTATFASIAAAIVELDKSSPSLPNAACACGVLRSSETPVLTPEPTAVSS